MNKSGKTVLTKPYSIRVFDARFFHRLCYEYINAFEALEKSERKALFFTPRFYLVSHAIELAMKSILIHHGYDEEELKKVFDHDLKKLTGELELKGYFHFKQQEQEDLINLNKYYFRKDFEYLQRAGVQILSRLSELSKLAWKLIRFCDNLITK